MATIKKGTYRFNDVLDFSQFLDGNNGYNMSFSIVPNTLSVNTELADFVNQVIDSEGYPVEYLEVGEYNVRFNFDSITVYKCLEYSALAYGVIETTYAPSSIEISPYSQALELLMSMVFSSFSECYHTGTSSVQAGWNSWNYFSDMGVEWVVSPKYIVVNDDTDITTIFAEWFTSNTKPCVTVEYNGAVIASLNAGQSATLECKDLPMLDNVVVTVPEGMGGADVPEWDGSYTVSGGTISFTIDGTSYEAEDGMTWSEWVESEYANYAPMAYCNGGLVYYSPDGNNAFVVNGVTAASPIESGGHYTLLTTGGGVD